LLVGTAKRERKKANRQLARQAQDRSRRLSVLRRRGLIAGVGVPLVVLALFGLARLQDDGDGASVVTTTTLGGSTLTSVVTTTTLGGSTLIGDTPCPAATGEQRVSTFEKAPPMCIDEDRTYVARIVTTEGEMTVELDASERPVTVNNFVVLARYGYYDGTTLFRTNTDIDIIQGGGLSNMDGPGYTIPDEGDGYTYERGQLIMARSSAPDSGSAQFFFATGPKVAALNGQGDYVPFGRVTEGLDVLDRIMAMHVGAGGGAEGAPSRTVTVRSITITES
jgi:cyclophilin family peptidyl-prolyl cis-trans isomerase